MLTEGAEGIWYSTNIIHKCKIYVNVPIKHLEPVDRHNPTVCYQTLSIWNLWNNIPFCNSQHKITEDLMSGIASGSVAFAFQSSSYAQFWKLGITLQQNLGLPCNKTWDYHATKLGITLQQNLTSVRAILSIIFRALCFRQTSISSYLWAFNTFMWVYLWVD